MVFKSPRQRKSLSQVFLKEKWPCDRIVSYLVQKGAQNVLEIGPGGGMLTETLVERGFSLTAVEKDERYAALLSKKFPQINLICEDILQFNLEEWLGSLATPHPPYLVGNLPYQISSPILYAVTPLLPQVGGCAFMFQKEFAERLRASPGSSEFSHLSVMMQLQSKIELLAEVPKEAFTPIPKVDSEIVSIEAYPHGLNPKQIKRIDTLSKVAFTQRRKKLSNSLSSYFNKGSTQPPIDLNLRAGALSANDYLKLAKFLFQGDF